MLGGRHPRGVFCMCPPRVKGTNGVLHCRCIPQFSNPLFRRWSSQLLQPFTTVDVAAMHTGVQLSLRDPAFSSFANTPRSGTLDPVAGLVLILEEATVCFAQRLHYFTVSPTVHRVGSHLLHFLTEAVVSLNSATQCQPEKAVDQPP